MFNLKSTAIYQVLKLQQNPFFRFSKQLRVIFFGSTIFFFLIFFFGAFLELVSEPILQRVLAGAFISLTLGIFFFELHLFFNLKIKNPALKYKLSEFLLAPFEFNFASFLDIEAAEACRQAEKLTKKKKLKETAKEILLYFVLSLKSREIEFVFGRAELSLVEIKKRIRETIKTLAKESRPSMEEIILQSAKLAQKRNKERISAADILTILAGTEPLQKILIQNNLRDKDIENLAKWHYRISKRLNEAKKFWSEENLLRRGNIGKDFSAGYSIALDNYSFDLREKINKIGFREVVGHEKEISFVERILEKEEINNVLLVGEPGTGRKSIITAISQRAFLGKSSPKVNYKRIIDFDIGQLSAETLSNEEFEARLEECFREAVSAGNIIMVISDLERYLSAGPGPGKVDISGILARYLPLHSFQAVGITSYKGLH